MHRIILDTNVIVSSLISDSYPTKIVFDLVLNELVSVCISEDIINEYYEVLNRKKFRKIYTDSQELLSAILEISELFFPKKNFNIINDESDNKFLDLAYECKSDYLITGNSKDFTFTNFYDTKIVSPYDYWLIFNT